MTKPFWTKLSPVTLNILIAFIVVTVVTLYFYFVKFQGNITGFFRIGSILPLSPYLDPTKILIYQGEIGYDGQQFLSLAFDPFLQNPETIGTLDHPIYRYRRLFYPLISYLLSFGNRQLIPYVMVGINYVCIILMVGIVSLYFKSEKSFRWHPLLTLCIPGVWMVLALGTADLLSSLLLITALYCYRFDKPVWTSVAIAIACLTRETLLLIWLALLLTGIIQHKKDQIKCLLWALIPPFLWTFYISFLNLPGRVRVRDNFGYPFVGIFKKFLSIIAEGFNLRNFFEAYTFILLLACFLVIFFLSKRYIQEDLVIHISNLFYGIMLGFSSMTILGYYVDYSRVFMDLYFLLLLVQNKRLVPWKTGIMSASGLICIAFWTLHS